MRFLDRYFKKYAFWRKWRGIPEPKRSIMCEIITREALSILEENLRFGVGGPGNKGKTINIRKPSRFESYINKTKEEHF
jgi:hypothetical protein